MTYNYETSPLQSIPVKCPRCGRRRGITVTVHNKERDYTCTCQHTWHEERRK